MLRKPGRNTSSTPTRAGDPSRRPLARAVETSAIDASGRLAVTHKIPARVRGKARRDAAAFYLAELARGLLAGELGVGRGDQTISLATTEFVLLEIEVKQKKRVNHVGVKLRWPRRPLIRAAAMTAEDG